MDVSRVPEGLVAQLRATDEPISWQLRRIIGDPKHPLSGILESELEAVINEALAECSDEGGRLANTAVVVLANLIERAIYEKRRTQLLVQGNEDVLFRHPALIDTKPDRDKLLPLAEFHVAYRRLERRGFVFSLCRPLPASNSHHWVQDALLSLPDERRNSVWVRLDPYVAVPVGEHASVGYKVCVYGQKLDWKRIAENRQVESGRWTPDELSSAARLGIQFTDIVWEPRSDGVHLECEEVPDDHNSRPARYLHAIFCRERRSFIHLDGAVRFYTEQELMAREESHLKDLGKEGTRIKIFRVDEPVSCDEWARLVASFFMWNNDLSRYVQAQRGMEEEHSSLLAD